MRKKIISVILGLLLSSCAAAPVEKKAEPPEEELSVSKQESLALESFNRILEVSQSSADRQAVVPEMERMYLGIINNYPDAALAQESYLRLIEIYIHDHVPPSYSKAEGLYRKFIKKHSGSVLRGFIEETIAKNYYVTDEWARLFNFTSPVFKQYARGIRQPRPALIFMYSEAGYNLGRLREAEEGYALLLKLFPGRSGDAKARARLEEIRKKQGRTK